jgi:repressor of nif and glnA expression
MNNRKQFLKQSMTVFFIYILDTHIVVNIIFITKELLRRAVDITPGAMAAGCSISLG